MFNINALGDYVTSGNNIWYFLGGFFFVAACFWVYGFIKTPKTAMYAFNPVLTIRYLYRGPAIIFSSIAVLYGSFRLFQFEQKYIDGSANLLTWHPSYLGVAGALLGICAGVFITYTGWRQWQNKPPTQD